MDKINSFIYTFKTAVSEIWPMLTLLLVMYLLIRITYLLIHREHFCFYKEIYMLLTITYVLFLYYLLLGLENAASYGINVVPFREITRYKIGSNLFIYNVVGNIAVFIPFGLFLNYILKTKNVIYTLLIAIIVSLTAELIQYRIGRAFDVDDVLLNTFGAFIGYLFYRLTELANDKLPEFLRKAWFYNIICLLILGSAILFLLYVWGVV